MPVPRALLRCREVIEILPTAEARISRSRLSEFSVDEKLNAVGLAVSDTDEISTTEPSDTPVAISLSPPVGGRLIARTTTLYPNPSVKLRPEKVTEVGSSNVEGELGTLMICTGNQPSPGLTGSDSSVASYHLSSRATVLQSTAVQLAWKVLVETTHQSRSTAREPPSKTVIVWLSVGKVARVKKTSARKRSGHFTLLKIT